MLCTCALVHLCLCRLHSLFSLSRYKYACSCILFKRVLQTLALKMSESKAAEDYRNFESLRNRFSDTTGASSPSRSAEPRKSSKRRFDPRVNAPPLVPLVEEGDQPPEAKVSFFLLRAERKGRGWGCCKSKREGLGWWNASKQFLNLSI